MTGSTRTAARSGKEPASARRRLLLSALTLVLCLAVTFVLWTRAERLPVESVAGPTPTPTSTPTVSDTPSPTPSQAVSPGVPVEVRVDAVGLDAEVLPTASVAGAFDPPTLQEAYWIEAFGAPGTASDNTVYLLGHSWDDGDAVFNALFDRASQTSTVKPGDEVVVSTSGGDVRYVVDRTERLAKEDVARETNEIWDVVPGRLLLITCFQNEDGGATLDNFVIFATVQG